MKITKDKAIKATSYLKGILGKIFVPKPRGRERKLSIYRIGKDREKGGGTYSNSMNFQAFKTLPSDS